MKVLKSYLTFLSEISKWKEKVVSGELSPQSIEKLKKTGVVKPKREYYKGFTKGTKELMRKTGAYLKYSKDVSTPAIKPSSGKPGGTPVIHIPLRSDVSFKKTMKHLKIPEEHLPHFIRISKRHEADEAALLKKLQKRYGSAYFPRLKIVSKKGAISTHYGPEVLKKERQYATLLSKLYDDPGARALIKSRMGELGGKLAKRGSEYQTLEKIKKRQLRKARERAAKEKQEEAKQSKAELLSLLRRKVITPGHYRRMLRQIKSGTLDTPLTLKVKEE